MLKRTYDIKNGELKQAIEKSGLELREFTTLSLEKMNVKSKKKRIRQKTLKRAFTQNEVAKEILLMVQRDNKASKQEDQEVVQAVEGTDSAAPVRGLPVTFLLKLGKKYLKDEEVVRYYYNADKEKFYKNKKLLEQVIETNSKNLESNQLAEFQRDVMAELEKRAKK